MNPYVYSKKGKDDVPTPPPVGGSRPSPSVWSKVKALFGASISPLMVVALLALSSGTVVLGVFGISQADLDLSTVSLAPAHLVSGKVLGDTVIQPIIDDSALEAPDPSAKLAAKPVNFDQTSGRWNYTITYSVANLTGSGTLTIGTYVVSSNVTVSGSVDTGTILKPNMVYYVSLWNVDSSYNKQNLAHIKLKTGKAKVSPVPPVPPLPCPQNQLQFSTSSAATTFCIKKDDGTTQCMPRICGMFDPEKHSTSTPVDLGHGDNGRVPEAMSSSTIGNLPPAPPIPRK